MKIKKYLLPLFLAGIFLATGSCNKFGDINTDPINPTSMDPLKQLIYAQMNFSGSRTVYLRSGMGIILPLLQQMSGTNTGASGSRYTYSESVYSALWTSDFLNLITNLVDAVENSKEDADRPNLHAMCRIMKVIAFARLTDLYGDIPYSQAGKGYIDLNIYPTYDKQEDIYNDFFKELREAYAMLDESKDKVSTEQYFHGDISKWKKLANSLRLRFAMRLVKVNPEKARTEAEAAVADGVMESNADICSVKYEDIQSSGTELRGNGLSVAMTSTIYRINTTFLDFLKPDDPANPVDPRLYGYTRSYYSQPSGSGSNMFLRPDITKEVDDYYAALPGNNAYSGVVGLDQGNTSIVNFPALSAISINVPGVGARNITHQDQRRQVANYLTYWDAPFLVMTYSEVSLLLAEAKVRGWNVGANDAETFYQDGVRASIDQLQIFRNAPALSGIDEFVASKTLVPGSELEAINTELYLSLFLNPQEAFANWRRSGYPVLISTGTPADRPMIRRFQYPLNEEDQNNSNVSEAVARINGVDGEGVDSFLNRVWWDKE